MKRLAWSDSRYVRLYCDDHPDWIALSFEAQGMYALLRREADRAGMIPLGLGGVRDLPSVIRQSARTNELMPFVQELISKRFLEIGETHAIVPEFIESETALASPAARKRKEREMRRDAARLIQDVTSGRHARVTPRDAAPTSHQDVTTVRHDSTSHVFNPESHQDVTTGRHDGGHDGGHDNGHVGRSLSSFQIISDQIPPIPPQGGNGGEGERVHDDPNLEDIRRKLLSMGKPLCYLPSARAEERLYAPVMGGAMTTAHVLQAIDDAAVSLGPELGTVQPDDKPGLAALERFVAGCVKRARRERHAPIAPVPTPRAQQAHGALHMSEPGPEALDVLDRFREMYTSVGNYDRFVAGPDDARFAVEVVTECTRHAGDDGDWRDILLRAIEAYMQDDFYANQGHSFRRFSAVLKSEPTRFIGRRRASAEQARAEEQARKEHAYYLSTLDLDGIEDVPARPRAMPRQQNTRDVIEHVPGGLRINGEMMCIDE